MVFDLLKCQEKWRAKGLGMRVTGVDFSPDSKTLATASSDHLVRLWQADDGRELVILRGHQDEPFAIRFAADGEILFVGDKGRDQGLVCASKHICL